MGGSRAGAVRKLLVSLTVVVGCADGSAGTEWAGEVRDSADVVLVENFGAPLWDSASAWRVGRDLMIGGDDTRPETLFGYVADLAVDAAGRMYVLDQHAQAIRVFAPDGSTLRTLGGPGRGPGEVSRFALSLVARGDTLLLVDWGQARLTRYHTDGRFLDAAPLPTQGGARTWWRAGTDALYLRSLQRYVDDRGRWQGRDALLRLEPGAGADTVLVFDYHPTDLGGPEEARFPLLVNAPSWTVLEGGGAAWLALDEGRVRIHDATGALRRVVTSRSWVQREPTPAEARLLEEKAGEKLEMLGGSREALGQLPVEQPDRLPAVTSVVAGPEGTLWVQRLGHAEDVHPMALNTPDPPSGYGGGIWDVLDAEGRLLGSIELPARARVMRVVGDALYAVQRDELDVERVVRLRVSRPTAG
jgi:hypothetical protein